MYYNTIWQKVKADDYKFCHIISFNHLTTLLGIVNFSYCMNTWKQFLAGIKTFSTALLGFIVYFYCFYCHYYTCAFTRKIATIQMCHFKIKRKDGLKKI